MTPLDDDHDALAPSLNEGTRGNLRTEETAPRSSRAPRVRLTVNDADEIEQLHGSLAELGLTPPRRVGERLELADVLHSAHLTGALGDNAQRTPFYARLARSEDGEPGRWVRVTPAPDGARRQLMIEDAHERMNTPEMRALREHGFREIADALPLTTWIATPTGKLHYISASSEQLTGLARSAIKRRGWLATVHPNERERVWGEFEAAANARAPFETSYRFPDRDGGDGETRYVHVYGTPLLAEDGALVGYAGRTIDTSDVHAERAKKRQALGREAVYTRFARHMAHLLEESRSAEDVDTFHQHLLDAAIDVTPGAQAGAALARRGAEGRHRFVAASGFELERLRDIEFAPDSAGFYHPPGDPNPRILRFPIPRDTNAELVVREGSDVDLGVDGRLGEIQATLVVPIVVRGVTEVFLTLDNFDAPEAFDEGGIEMMRAFAQTAAGLIERLEMERQIADIAFHEPITGLANEARLHYHLDEALLRIEPERGERLALLLVRCPTISHVAHGRGRAAGDEVAAQLARRLERIIPPRALAARPSLVNMFIALEGADAEDAALERTLTRLHSHLAAPILANNEVYYPKIHTGLALLPDDADSPDALIDRAQLAGGYAERARIVGHAHRYQAGMERATMEHLTFEAGMRHGIERDEFTFDYQPRIDIASGTIRGVEALARWRVQGSNVAISPEEFIPQAERSGLIIELGRVLMRKAIRQAAAWRQLGHEVPIAINVSTPQIDDGSLLDDLDALTTMHGVPYELLEIEVTERAAFIDTAYGLDVLASLRARGARIALDDFGHGQHSLDRFASAPIDMLKLDRSLLAPIGGESHEARAMAKVVKAIAMLSRDLGVTVVAEGVERYDQWALLASLGVQEVQGYLIARPMPAGAITELLVRGQPMLPSPPSPSTPSRSTPSRSNPSRSSLS